MFSSCKSKLLLTVTMPFNKRYSMQFIDLSTSDITDNYCLKYPFAHVQFRVNPRVREAVVKKTKGKKSISRVYAVGRPEGRIKCFPMFALNVKFSISLSALKSKTNFAMLYCSLKHSITIYSNHISVLECASGGGGGGQGAVVNETVFVAPELILWESRWKLAGRLSPRLNILCKLKHNFTYPVLFVKFTDFKFQIVIINHMK